MKTPERVTLVAGAAMKAGAAGAFGAAARFCWVMSKDLPQPLDLVLKGMAVGMGGTSICAGLLAANDVRSAIAGEKPYSGWAPFGHIFGDTMYVQTMSDDE